MSANFKAILVSRDDDKKQSVGITELSEADLMEGDVTVAVEAPPSTTRTGWRSPARRRSSAAFR